MTAGPVRIDLTETIDTVPVRVLGRSHLACVRCRTQKTKCDGEKPTCKTCLLSNKSCFYEFKDRKIILFESQLNKLQSRIKYLEANLKNLTSSSDVAIIDSSLDMHSQQDQQQQDQQQANQIIKKEEDLDDDGGDSLATLQNLSPTGFLNQQYPTFANPLFGSPESFNQDYFNPTHRQRVSFDKIFIDPRPKNLVESFETSNRNLLQFDYALQNCLGEFAYFDSINPKVSNFHPNSKHYLSDNYFDYPFNGYITLPEKEYTLELFDIVFKRLGHLHYVFQKAEFLEQVNKVYEDLNSQTASFVCKLLITLAIGEQLVFSKLSFDPNFILKYGERTNSGIAGLKFFTLAIQLFRYNHESFDVSNIQTCLLVAYYEQILNRTTSLFSYYGLAMKLSLASGFHRKISGDNSDPIKKEQRKRLWWTVYTMAVRCAAKLHLPLEVSYADTDIDLPLQNSIDIGDGFDVELLDAEVKICRYFNGVIKGVYGVNTRTFDNSYEPKDPKIVLNERLDHTTYVLSQYEKVKRDLDPIFQKFRFQVSSMAKAGSRDEMNILLTYHCAVIFTTRPIVLSFFRGLLKETDQTRKIASAAIDSACEIINILQYLRNTFLLQTFDYWDNQHCFTALLILTVAGMAGIKSPLSAVGIDIMAFMANCGNHSARAYFQKLIVLDDCLISSGHDSIYGKPLSSLRSYPSIETTTGVAEDNNKILVKTLELSVDEFRMAPRKVSKRLVPQKKLDLAVKELTTGQQQTLNQGIVPIFDKAGKSLLPQQPPKSQSQRQRPKQKQQTQKQQNHSPSQLRQPPGYQQHQSVPRVLSPQNVGLTSSLQQGRFGNDPDFFNDLVSSIQVWENPFSQNFISQQQANSNFNPSVSTSDPGSASQYNDLQTFATHDTQQNQQPLPQLAPSRVDRQLNTLSTLLQPNASNFQSSQFMTPIVGEHDVYETGGTTAINSLPEAQLAVSNMSLNQFQNFNSK